MIRKKVTTKIRGRISIRSYERQEAIDNKESMAITYKGETMTLTPRELKVKIKWKSELYKSKIGGKDYYLYGYLWNPDD